MASEMVRPSVFHQVSSAASSSRCGRSLSLLCRKLRGERSKLRSVISAHVRSGAPARQADRWHVFRAGGLFCVRSGGLQATIFASCPEFALVVAGLSRLVHPGSYRQDRCFFLRFCRGRTLSPAPVLAAFRPPPRLLCWIFPF